ncbi:MAG: hypothetical protein QOF78_3255 [Phycisphaerales bacterium]|jgi:ribosomal protein S18 acetylase RimI-like enzyme|nr:hypothetical protein [Phycisphaerales bacterium]
MCANEDNKIKSETSAARRAPELRIEPIDNWHVAWRRVLTFVAKHGGGTKLQVDSDGWLSARQVLIVAFVGEQIAAHVCFSVSPGKKCIEAKLDSHGIAPKFAGRGIESQLHRAAIERAESLRCQKLKGFKLNSKWC